MKLTRSLLAPLALLLAVSSQAQQRQLEHVDVPERRVALVIGNSAYKVGPLKNPVNDARAMAAALRELGFEVIQREDLKREDLRRAIREFGAQISRGGVGLFYYAGHGVQVRGENYLIPVDADPESADEVDDDGVKAGYVLEKMDAAGNGMNIVILDACRNNPFTRSFRSGSDGLASVNAPTGTLIAYATAPGAVASDGGNSGNGIYTQELLKIIKTPGLGIEEVFKRVRVAVRRRTQGKQIPWEASSLEGDFYFSVNERRNTSPVKVAEPVDAETGDWERIRNSADPKDFEAFLKKYPLGRFSQSAKDSLNVLAKAKETAGLIVNEPTKKPSTLWDVDGIPFLVVHRHTMSMKFGRLFVSPEGLEFREHKSGDASHAFTVPCGQFVISMNKEGRFSAQGIKIRMPGRKDMNLSAWGREEDAAAQAVSDYCSRPRPANPVRDVGGRSASAATRDHETLNFKEFQVHVAYGDSNRLAEAARIANRLWERDAFAAVTKLHTDGKKTFLLMQSMGSIIENVDTQGADAVLFYHDDLEGVAKEMARELGDLLKVVTRKTGQGKRDEFYLWIP